MRNKNEKLQEEFTEYRVIMGYEIRYDIGGCRYTGFDAIDPEDDTCWGIYEDSQGELHLMR